MKRLMYVTGYLFALAFTAGMLFKTLHLSGAGVLLGTGAIGLIGVFLPLLIFNKYKHIAREVMSERLKWIFGVASMFLLLLSITMKMLHLMGASLMLGFSFLVFGFGFLPFLFFNMYKKSMDEL